MSKSAFIFAISLILIIFVNVCAMASELAYTCEVKHIYALSSEGSLKPAAHYDKKFKGNSFSVSRLTGEIIGRVLPTLMAKSTRVINKGSKEWSFRAVADFGNVFQIIVVEEFKEGVLKPFVSSSMGGAGIVTGLCK